ncbi:PucR family transcriptional regulator [Falsibacillus albus]|nr:helix-turn-helix domain-containing protein [Falsibacillus albus]
MLENLLKQFPNAVLQSLPPVDFDTYHWFFDPANERFAGVSKTEINEDQLTLLQILFPFQKEEVFRTISGQADAWHQFLFQKQQELPAHTKNKVRIIQFAIFSESPDLLDFEALKEALQSIFSHNVTIGMMSANDGFIVEEKLDAPLAEEELLSAMDAFESDFYIKSMFYLGRFADLDEDFTEHFAAEQRLFHFARSSFQGEKLFSFEKVFPVLLVKELNKAPHLEQLNFITEIFAEDHELMTTIKTYIENQNNTSLTAKQLYMHRNSLQYRIDKFSDLAGIDLKTFTGTLTVYLACLQFEYLNL